MKRQQVLLINPTVVKRAHARFPLSLLTLSATLADRYAVRIIDGNLDRDFVATARKAVAGGTYCAVGVSVMGGPQLRPAIEVSRAIRAASPATPVIWGGYFPTLYPEAAANADYVDYVLRGPVEQSLLELLGNLDPRHPLAFAAIDGLSRRQDGSILHNPLRRRVATRPEGLLPYHLLGDPRKYLGRTFLGNRTAVHQAATGCRFRCTFCGVAAMFRGATTLSDGATLERDLRYLKEVVGADSIHYMDNNFFDREVDMMPMLEVQARMELPWWCFARADAMLNLSSRSWDLIRKSRLRMAYIGAESPSDATLRDLRKGTRCNQTIDVVRLCRAHGVVPELSFMVAPPQDPEGETERTFEFIRQIKKISPEAEIVVYVYTPIPGGAALGGALPTRSGIELLDVNGDPVVFPATPEEWALPQWVAYACHADAPWLTERLRSRIRDFVTVLSCRFPTTQDIRSPSWAKAALRHVASARYSLRRYDRPWELHLSQRLVRLADPRATSL